MRGVYEKLSILVAVLSMGGGVVAYAFVTFESKEDSRDQRKEVFQRLERIETKIDTIIRSQ